MKEKTYQINFKKNTKWRETKGGLHLSSSNNHVARNLASTAARFRKTSPGDP